MENIVKINEIEEFENNEQDIVNTSEEGSNGSGALVTGIIGGLLAYVLVSGGKKLVKFVKTKCRERKLAKAEDEYEPVDVDYTEISDEQRSDENAEN